MIRENKRLDEVNPAYHYIGKEKGYDMYVVPICENNSRKKEINLDDCLIDDDWSNEYYSC